MGNGVGNYYQQLQEQLLKSFGKKNLMGSQNFDFGRGVVLWVVNFSRGGLRIVEKNKKMHNHNIKQLLMCLKGVNMD